jgi:uncharacterized repeat protein (TIGR03843 family)
MSRVEWAPAAGLTPEEGLALLEEGDVEVLGLLPYSSNYVFLTKVTRGETESLAVYKPRRGERPLWDFPAGSLAAREVAAFIVGRAAGWDFVPPTVMRMDAPLGAGSLQLFIEHDPDRHFFVLMEEVKQRPQLAAMAAFDIAINNADRKGGHVLEGEDGRLWAVDHGLSFNVEPKLRTVIWGFAGDELDEATRAALHSLREELKGGGLEARLDELLSAPEVAETLARVEMFLRAGHYPHPSGPYSMPWPLV